MCLFKFNLSARDDKKVKSENYSELGLDSKYLEDGSIALPMPPLKCRFLDHLK